MIVLASSLGGWIPTRIALTHTRMQLIISFVGGLMLGIAVFHLLPHAIAELGMERVNWVTSAVMAGMLVMFFLLRAFHFHQHGPADFGPDVQEHHCEAHAHLSNPAVDVLSSNHHGDQQSRHHRHHHTHHPHTSNQNDRRRWIGVLVGLGVHTLMDGVALAAAVAADSHRSEGFALWGIGVFLAILLHKPLDAISITSLMRVEGKSNLKIFVVNIGFAMMIPMGAGIVVLGLIGGGDASIILAGLGLAFSAGVFLCISLSDLLPEMEFHSHNRKQLTVALLAGILLSALIGYLEPEHAHADHQHQHDKVSIEH